MDSIWNDAPMTGRHHHVGVVRHITIVKHVDLVSTTHAIDYSPFFSTVAVVVPVFLIALFAGRDRLVKVITMRREPQVAWRKKALKVLGYGIPLIYLLAGLVAEGEALSGLYDPTHTSRGDRAATLYSLAVVLAAVLVELGAVIAQTPFAYRSPRADGVDAGVVEETATIEDVTAESD